MCDDGVDLDVHRNGVKFFRQEDGHLIRPINGSFVVPILVFQVILLFSLFPVNRYSSADAEDVVAACLNN